MDRRYDVIVIGGRVAGSTLATHLARRGLSVCVLERGDLQNEVVSTHIVFTNTITNLVEHTGVDLGQLMASRAPALRALMFELQDVIVAELPLPGPFYCLRRRVLDNAVLDAARRAGAEIRLNTRVSGVVTAGNRVAGVSVAGGELQGRIVVGADGMSSTIARAVGAEAWYEVPSERFCYYSYFPVAEPETDRAWFSFDNTADRCGYLTFPTGQEQVLVGCYPRNDRLGAFQRDLEGAFKDQLSRLPRTARYAEGERAERIYGIAKMPTYIRRSVGPGWALVGDAGYFKDPVIAQGIADAVSDGMTLADVIERALGDPSSEAGIMDAWERERDLAAIDVVNMGVQMSRAQEPSCLVAQMLVETQRRPELLPVMGGIYQRTRVPAEFFSPVNVGRALVTGRRERRGSAGELLSAALQGARSQLGLVRTKRRIRTRPPRDWTLGMARPHA